MTTPPLHRAYRAARYRIACGTRWIERRIDRADAAADAALVAAGCVEHWHVLTPCNPGSQRLGDEDNRRRVAALHADLAPHAWIVLPALNIDSDGSWPEPGVCILDAPRDRICHLARAYGQLAIVAGTLGAAPRLVWIGAPALGRHGGDA